MTGSRLSEVIEVGQDPRFEFVLGWGSRRYRPARTPDRSGTALEPKIPFSTLPAGVWMKSWSPARLVYYCSLITNRTETRSKGEVSLLFPDKNGHKSKCMNLFRRFRDPVDIVRVQRPLSSPSRDGGVRTELATAPAAKRSDRN
jgi:hypothetical protein